MYHFKSCAKRGDIFANILCRLRSPVVDYSVHRYGERLSDNRFDADSGQIWLNNVQCVGNETSLADCEHNGWSNHNCTHSEDVSLACTGGIVTNSSQ